MVSYLVGFCFISLFVSAGFIILALNARCNYLENEVEYLRNLVTIQASMGGAVVDDRVARMARMATANAPEWAADSGLVSDFINKVERGDDSICL